MSISDFLWKVSFFIASVYFFVVIIILQVEIRKITGPFGNFIFTLGTFNAFFACWHMFFTPSKKKD